MPAFFSLSDRLAPLAIALAGQMAFVHAAEPADKPEPQITIDADAATAREGEYAEARGSVTLVRDGLKVESDWLRYDFGPDKLKAGDKVVMQHDAGTLSGSRLEMSVTAREGDLFDPVFQMQRGALRGDAVKLIFDGPNRYVVQKSRITSCEVGRDDWYIHSSTLELDYNKNRGEAWNGWLEFQGTPILYYPWIDFPLDGNRKSGMLAPSFGVSSRNGVQLVTPIYLDLAPNYDATLYPRYMNKSGVMTGGEFRYLQPGYTGIVRADTIHDKIAGMRRNSAGIQHKQQFSKELQLEVNAQKVSDNAYLSDFGEQLSVSSQSNLPREGKLTYTSEEWSAMLRWQRYQTLTTPTNIVDKPYDRIPQLLLNARPQMMNGMLFNASAEVTDFQHPDKTSGIRTWAYPSVAIPYNESWGFVTPKVGMHATRYQLNSSTPTTDMTRTLPIASVDSGLYFERETNFLGKETVQTLEPRAYYLYIPYRNQSNLPVFDTGETDLSFTQMFSENQFSGQDRINDANQLTLAMTSRLFEGNSGIELFNITMGQRYYFTDQRVTLTSPSRPDSVKRSDLLMTVGARFWKDFSANYAMQYNQVDGSTRRADLTLAWRPGDYKAINLRYANNRIAETRQFDISGQWPLYKGWHALGRFNYSIEDRRALETLGGFEYNAGCWALRLAGQRYATSTSEYRANYYILLELGGVAGIGSNPLDAIRKSIPGYSNTYNPPQF